MLSKCLIASDYIPDLQSKYWSQRTYLKSSDSRQRMYLCDNIHNYIAKFAAKLDYLGRHNPEVYVQSYHPSARRQCLDCCRGFYSRPSYFANSDKDVLADFHCSC